MDEEAVIEKLLSIKGAKAAFHTDRETFSSICRLEMNVSTTTAGMAMENRALDACMGCTKHVVIFCDGDLELPEGHIPVMMLALGYPRDKAKPSDWHFKRMPLEDFVTEL